jgi:hypothetical protein
MTKIEATAEVFWTAFKALSRREQDAVVIRLAEDKRLREDLIDIAVALERKDDPTRPLTDVLAEIEAKKNK